MAKYLISFPSASMVLTEAEYAAVEQSSREAIRAAKAAGVYVFAGGIDEAVAPVLVHADGSVSEETSQLDGGFCVLEVPSRAEAEEWAARIAAGAGRPRSCGSSATTPSPEPPQRSTVRPRVRLA